MTGVVRSRGNISVSNVLIGIIGVILFIGLALAGALFLGPRFQEATQNSKASAAVQAVTQVAHAAVLYQTNEGVRLQGSGGQPISSSTVADTVRFRQGGYLKSVPVNPTGMGKEIGIFGDANGAVGNATDVAFSLGSTPNAAKLCDAIRKQLGDSAASPSTDPLLLVSAGRPSVGCWRPSATSGEFDAIASTNDYIVFARI
jgi:type II secretory pathway pseudopilin PulG